MLAEWCQRANLVADFPQLKQNPNLINAKKEKARLGKTCRPGRKGMQEKKASDIVLMDMREVKNAV